VDLPELPYRVAEPSAAAAESSAGAVESSAAAAEPPADAIISAGAPAPEPGGPRIVSPSRPPARGLMVGSDRREYPPLRGAIVKLAHDDPAVAGRLLAALLPAQGAVLGEPLAYDLTINGVGTFGVTVTEGRARVEQLDRSRPRSQAAFHVRGDPLALAEMLAGVDHKVRRFRGPVTVRGRRRGVIPLTTLSAASISLTDAARAGAALEPELVYRTLAYAIHPSWTRGHHFTIAQEITSGETWYLTARNGAGLAVSATAPGTPDATVTMTRAAFDSMLRGEQPPPGERPTVRGDREAVEFMRTWTLRVQGTDL
jgi:hypothetical protein